MKNILIHTSRLLLLLCLFCAPALAQVIIPHANDTRIGGQLLLYFDVVNYDVVYLTLTNTGSSTIPVHIQFFEAACEEEFNFTIRIPAGCLKIYDMRRFEFPSGQPVDLKGRQGFLLATPYAAPPESGAVPYNHLAGNSVHANLANKNSFGLNAVARLAVDSTGAPLADFSGTLNGTTRRFQNIQPSKLYLDGAFALDTLTDSRFILISFTDIYGNNTYTISGASVDLKGFATALDCQRISLQNRTFSCFFEMPLRTYLSGALTSFLNGPGSLELSTTYGPLQNLIGISSQTLATFTVNRYLWGK